MNRWNSERFLIFYKCIPIIYHDLIQCNGPIYFLWCFSLGNVIYLPTHKQCLNFGLSVLSLYDVLIICFGHMQLIALWHVILKTLQKFHYMIYSVCRVMPCWFENRGLHALGLQSTVVINILTFMSWSWNTWLHGTHCYKDFGKRLFQQIRLYRLSKELYSWNLIGGKKLHFHTLHC